MPSVPPLLKPGPWTDDTDAKVAALAARSFAGKGREEIRGSGYSVASLEAALWCFETHNDYASTVLAAANLGEDADTTAAIAGQLAGAYYGIQQLPRDWLERLHMRDEIESMATALLRAAERQ